MVAEKEVDVCTEAAVHVAKPPRRRCMLGDLRRRIPVLDRVQDTVRPLCAAAASGFTEDILYKRLLREAIRV